MASKSAGCDLEMVQPLRARPVTGWCGWSMRVRRTKEADKEDSSEGSQTTPGTSTVVIGALERAHGPWN